MKILRILKYVFIMILVIGVSILIGFFIRRQRDRRTQLKIMSDFEQRMGVLTEAGLDHHYQGATDAARSGPSVHVVAGDTIAILTLDRLGIRVAITEGTDKDALRVSAGHFECSDMPGEGNFAIAGHSSFIYTCLFNDMHKAVEGDIINVYAADGVHHYIISSIETVGPEHVEYLDHTNQSILTIVTCNNYGSDRLIVRAIEFTDKR